MNFQPIARAHIVPGPLTETRNTGNKRPGLGPWRYGMSLVLYSRINIESSPTIITLVRSLGLPAVLADGTPQIVSGQWTSETQVLEPDSRYFFYMPFESTRGIEVWIEDTFFCVSVLPFSAVKELDLALRFIESGARMLGAETVALAVDGVAFPISELRSRVTPDHLQQLSLKALIELIDMVKDRQDVLSLEGPIRAFRFGPFMAALLEGTEDVADKLAKLCEKIKLVQYWRMMAEFQDFVEPRVVPDLIGRKNSHVIEPQHNYVVSAALEEKFGSKQSLDELNFKSGKNCQVAVGEFIENWSRGLPPDKFELLDEYCFKLNLNAGDIHRLLEDNVDPLDRERNRFGTIDALAERLARKVRRERMTGLEFGRLVAKAQRLYDFDRKIYSIVVAIMAAIGYGYVLLFLGLGVWGSLVFLPMSFGSSGFPQYLAFLIGLTSASLVAAILKALLASVPPPRGCVIGREDVPGFFRLLDDLQAKFGIRIDSVVITGELNASIMQVPTFGILGGYMNYLTVGLPLLYATTKERAISILSHEMGHISCNHGRFNAWIFGLSTCWQAILEALAKNSKVALVLLLPFYSWYYPRFQAFAMVVNRQHEYEADHMATLVTDRVAHAESLIAVHVVSRFLAVRFFPQVARMKLDTQKPPEDLYSRMAKCFDGAITEQDARKWYVQALLMEQSPTDTHPPLADRLVRIGYPARQTRELQEAPINLSQLLTVNERDSAALGFLGPHAQRLAKELSKSWSDSVQDVWNLEHRKALEDAARLEDLEREQSKQRLDGEGWMSLASLSFKLRGASASLPVLRENLDRNPHEAIARFLLGQALLELDDADGVGLIEDAFNNDATLIEDGLVLTLDYCERHGMDDRVATCRKRLAEHRLSAALALEEREQIRVDEQFTGHDLSAATVEKIQACVSDCPYVEAAFLAKRKLRHLPGIPQYVLGIERPYALGSKQLDILASLSLLEQRLFKLDIHIVVLDLADFQRDHKGKFTDVPNCLVFSKRTLDSRVRTS